MILVPGLMDGHLQLDRWMDTTRHHHPGMGRSAIIETTARAKVIMDYGDKHQQNTETSSALVYTQWQKQNLTDTQTTYSEIHDLCLRCVAQVWMTTFSGATLAFKIKVIRENCESQHSVVPLHLSADITRTGQLPQKMEFNCLTEK